MKSLAKVLALSTDYLTKNGVEFAEADTQWLIAHALDLPRLQLKMQGTRELQEDELAAIRPLIKRRASGEPLQYILGSTEFFNCELIVGPGVLIPRPETERLVELALEKYPGEGEVLDLCTGSGAICLAMAKERPEIPALTGVDLSEVALDWAHKNRELLGLDAVHFVQGDLYEPVEGMKFSLITANPPYVSEDEREILPKDVLDFEPELALFADDSGLAVLKRIAAGVIEHLQINGWFISEIGETQGAAAAEVLSGAGLQDVEVVKDYTERERFVIGRNLPSRSSVLSRY